MIPRVTLRLVKTSSLEVFWDEGIVVRVGETVVCLDPQTSETRYTHVFISHAHKDHTAGFLIWKSKKYATSSTVDLFEATSKRKVSNLRRIAYGEKVKVKDFEVTAHDSGHILGSAMFELDTPEGVVVYTGDINCVNTLITSAANPVECDVLIIESTYGSPGYVFPSREEIYRNMVKWVVKKIHENRVPTFYVYSVGKAQEIIKMLNEFTEVEVLIHPTIARINKIYDNLNIKLEANSLISAQKNDRCVIVYPHYTFGSIKSKNEASAIATGWSLRLKKENAFPLSGHADFKQLLRFVEETKPKKVFTCFGSTIRLAKQIQRKLNIEAKPIQNKTGMKH
ncbi:hypothetical protein DRO26_00170 [Candidatus Bathyarchaeota archaeon]|nr:MAG: hypothetical protein DRO26_00170 [Candidatus Bathyarchaeota archaeon]